MTDQEKNYTIKHYKRMIKSIEDHTEFRREEYEEHLEMVKGAISILEKAIKDIENINHSNSASN